MPAIIEPKSADALHSLCYGEPACVAIVAAHPDDEVIGAGAQLARWHNVWLIHVTNGSPRDLEDARAAGFAHQEEYAQARRRELHAALDLIENARTAPSDGQISARPQPPSPAIKLVELGFTDKETAFHLCDITAALAARFRQIRPDVVLTHPYEGGHPDHDSLAFAARAACALLAAESGSAPALIEMTSYHAPSGRFTIGEFLADGDSRTVHLDLTMAQRELKRGLFDCFQTQRSVLAQFKV